MVIERARLNGNRRVAEAKAERREIAALLRESKYDKARIRVESVIRKGREADALDLLGLMAELLLERAPLVASRESPGVPADLQETVATLVWAASRAGIEELRVVREQLVSR